MLTLYKSLLDIFVKCKLVKKGAYIVVSKTNLGYVNIHEGYKILLSTAHFHLINDFIKIKARA